MYIVSDRAGISGSVSGCFLRGITSDTRDLNGRKLDNAWNASRYYDVTAGMRDYLFRLILFGGELPIPTVLSQGARVLPIFPNEHTNG